MSKAAIVFGVANQRSLAWSCTLALLNQANFNHVVCVYQNDRYKATVERLVEDQNVLMKQKVSLQSYSTDDSQYSPKLISCLECDVLSEDDVRFLFTDRLPYLLDKTLKNKEASQDVRLDALVHSVAFAPTDAMKGHESLPLLHTTQDAFVTSHLTSAFSLLTVSKHALNLLRCRPPPENDDNTLTPSKRSPSITALTYIGSSQAVRNYNIMGPAKASLESMIRGLALELGPEPYSIRVNGVSSGPVNTLAARGIKGFVEMKQEASKKSCLNRNVTADEVGNVVAFLADGEQSSGITGQIVFCDSGFSSVAM